MFRASPWITYDPPASDNQTPSQQLDNDTEMDAPQISTLHDDGESPPSNASPARTGKFRVKLLVNEARMATKFITFNGETGEEAGIGEEAEEEEPEEDEEEDQLIDDQDDTSTHAASTSGAVPAKAGTKRPPPKTKSSQAKRKVRPSGPSAPTPASQPAPTPSEPQTTLPKDATQDPPTLDQPPVVPQGASTPPVPASKKKAVPKGTTAAQRAPRKSAPTKPPKTAATAAIPPPSDAAADFSEGHTGTVPSSPAHVDARTPEPEAPGPSDAASISVAAAPEHSTVTLEDLDGIPHPRYPLPTKPFQVQPPPKISTGYAPVVSLDRTKTKPRHWRLAHREVRGIAGGRWFARAWVGDKDSELAVAAEAALSVPKLAVAATAAGARASGKRKPKVDAVSTAASSRSASAAPEAAAPPAPPQRSAIKRSGLSTTVATSEVDMDIDVS